ncbi:hypothetical protein [Hymenobacter sp. B81]|uniref:hypothetical protein n=1 Tax=Hymenobacter sp. B81 TaxID=3344878 RepID=UPI0037DC1B9A
MKNDLRDQLGLTQQSLASWLGIPRSSLALAERGRQSLPLSGDFLAQGRLQLAIQGQVYDPATGTTFPAPPPLPPPAPLASPLQERLDACQLQLLRLRRQLKRLQQRATQYQNRLVALPALRAYPGPLAQPEREARWLAALEQEAADALQFTCGAGPQRLLEARIAGLEREAELLAQLLADIPAADEQPPAAPGSTFSES